MSANSSTASSKRWWTAGSRRTAAHRTPATGARWPRCSPTDATYGWNMGPHEEFMAVGRDEIRDYALGMEMGGLDGWTYPYQKVLIDEHQGEVIGLWKQVADAKRPDGSPYEVAGLGGSWFRYAGNWQWSWQRDFFDFGNATALFIEMMRAGVLSEGMQRRLDRASADKRLPGHYAVGIVAGGPLGLNPVANEACGTSRP